MILPKTTKKQKYILYLLYKFRFIHTNQFQKLLNHKDPTRTQKWLKDLKDKGYIQTTDERETYKDYSLPFVYRITPQARQILKHNEDCNLQILSRVYKEKTRTEAFIRKCLAIVDLYLFFLSKKGKNDTLQYFTETELFIYDFFPETKPSAYIAIKTKDTTSRYFLEWFDKYIPPGVLRARFQEYLTYADSGDWEAHSQGEAFPSVLFVCPTTKRKNHIKYYAKGVFAKAYEEKINFFVTTQDKLHSNNTSIWEKVSMS